MHIIACTYEIVNPLRPCWGLQIASEPRLPCFCMYLVHTGHPIIQQEPPSAQITWDLGGTCNGDLGAASIFPDHYSTYARRNSPLLKAFRPKTCWMIDRNLVFNMNTQLTRRDDQCMQHELALRDPAWRAPDRQRWCSMTLVPNEVQEM